MDSLHPQIDAQAIPQPGYAVPREGFSFTVRPRELLLALLSYPVAYLYIEAFDIGDLTGKLLFTCFSFLFCLGVEYRHRGVRAGWERWVWLGCLALCVLCPLFGPNRVWEEKSLLFAHGFAIYYVLCRADVLLEGRTGHLLPLDALWGGIVFPFASFFLRLRVLWASLHRRRRGSVATVLWSVLAIAVAACIFVLAGSLLSAADKGFARLIRTLFDWKGFEPGPIFFKLMLSLPVGAYLYGLIAGTGRTEPEESRRRGGHICEALEAMRSTACFSSSRGATSSAPSRAPCRRTSPWRSTRGRASLSCAGSWCSTSPCCGCPCAAPGNRQKPIGACALRPR